MPLVSWSEEEKERQSDDEEYEEKRQEMYKVIDNVKEAAHTVMQHMGVGYSEAVYQEALECELRLRHIQYEHQPIVNIYYKGYKVGHHKPDLMVAGRIVIELKAFGSKATGKYQLKRYMYQIRHDPHSNQTDPVYGMLINFCDSPVTVQVFV